jgi:hypothetical protein
MTNSLIIKHQCYILDSLLNYEEINHSKSGAVQGLLREDLETNQVELYSS